MNATRARYKEAYRDHERVLRSRFRLRARIHHPGTPREFIHDCSDDWPHRDSHRYPDPFLQDILPEDHSLIAQYRHKISNVVDAFEPKNEQERLAANGLQEREQNRYNILLGKRAFPDPDEAGIDPELFERVDNASFSTGYSLFSRGRSVDWETYQTLMNDVPLDTLRYLAAYYRVNDQSLVTRELKSKTRVLNAIRYVRGDPTVSLDNILDFIPVSEAQENAPLPNDEIEEGVPFETIRNELSSFVRNHPTTLVALALANMEEVTNLHHPNLANGEYHTTFNVANFAIRMNDSDAKITRNVFVHEFFHSIQDLLGALDCNAENEPVDLDATPDKWGHVIFLEPDTEEINNIQEAMLHEWFRFRTGEHEELCEYQTKNIHEYFAVATEAYAEDPETLQNEQPKTYQIIHDTLTMTH